MHHYFNSITNTKGDALIGYFVRCVDATSGVAASLYADTNLTPIASISGVANAAQVDSDGNVSFYIAGGIYHFDIYAADSTTFVRRIQNIPMLEDVSGGVQALANNPALPIAYGGTAATDAATALSNLGALSSVYRDLPRVVKTSNFTVNPNERSGLVVSDLTSPATATLNPQSTTPIPDGATWLHLNTNGSALTFSPGGGVILYKNGGVASGTAVLAPGGQATLLHAYGDIWSITGWGVS